MRPAVVVVDVAWWFKHYAFCLPRQHLPLAIPHPKLCHSNREPVRERTSGLFVLSVHFRWPDLFILYPARRPPGFQPNFLAPRVISICRSRKCSNQVEEMVCLVLCDHAFTRSTVDLSTVFSRSLAAEAEDMHFLIYFAVLVCKTTRHALERTAERMGCQRLIRSVRCIRRIRSFVRSFVPPDTIIMSHSCSGRGSYTQPQLARA